MITELVGPPGSGKSTMARSLAERDGGRVVKLNGFAYGASLSRVKSILTQPSCRLWIEDGPLFALTRMINDDTSQRQISGVVWRLRLPDRCIVMRASPATCLYRLKQLRYGTNRLARLEPSQELQVLAGLNRATELLLECLPAGVDVTYLNNDETIDGLVAQQDEAHLQPYTEVAAELQPTARDEARTGSTH